MKKTIKSAAVLGLLISAPLVQADSFTGFNMDFVDIGNADNAADNTGYGAVDYNYRIGVHEVSRGMIEAYNTNSGGPTLTLADMTSYGGNGANRPATGINWNEAARFVNWLNTSTGHAAAYKFTTNGANSNLMEFLAGTDPKDTGSHFKPEGSHNGTIYAIPIQTIADRKYEVFASRNLTNWHLQETYTGDGTQKVFNFDETTMPAGPLYSATHPSSYFFRVKITEL